MKFGFHISISGGLSKVAQRAEERGCQTIQIFSRNPRGWKYGPLDLDEVQQLTAGLGALAISPLVVHMPYLANLASPEKELHAKSVDSLTEELNRAQLLSARFVVMHVGKRMASSEDQALERVAEGVGQALRTADSDAALLLENTAGQASEVGEDFRRIGDILARVSDTGKAGVCLDTAHAFEAGYDLSTPEGLESALAEFERTIGLDRLQLLHLNDSKTPLGSHVDRHWHIGEGFIGLEGFRNIVNHPKLTHLPAIMETPPGVELDQKNMETVKGLAVQ